MTRRHSHRIAAVCALASSLLAATAGQAAPRKQAQADEPFFGSVDVNVVNVEVFVTDKAGRFVPGLTRDDFEIFEDGKPVELTNFYVADSPAPDPANPPAGGNAAAPSAAPSAMAAVPEEQRLTLTVFLDNQSLTAVQRNRMVEPLQELIQKRLGPGDQLMVVSYEGSGDVLVRQAMTGDRAAVAAALDKVAHGSALGSSRQLEVREILRQMETRSSDESADASLTYGMIRTYAERRTAETRRSLEALGKLLDALAGLPGRKALLYVSGGLSLRPAQALLAAWSQRYGGNTTLEGFETDVSALFRSVGERANANRITFYTLALPNVFSGRSAATADSDWKGEHETVETVNVTQSLQLVTAPTGGLISLDPSTPRVLLDQMLYDFDHYYSLGYAPAAGRPPGDHRLQIKVKRPGLKVRHRGSFTDRSVDDRLVHQSLAALMLGAKNQNPLDVRVRFEGERPGKKGRREVSMVVMFPLSKVALLPQGETHQGRVSLLVGARDTKGRTSGVTRLVLPVRIADSTLPGALKSVAAYRARVEIGDGPHRIVISLRDEYGNVSSVVTVPYGTGAAAAKSGR
ncbi:MAG TPA: VWA domain-containing protein [Thermoanaerobaculia bacterium]|nr:VWA domain-containing protein [Thermoanaerobaculia bacterium]